MPCPVRLTNDVPGHAQPLRSPQRLDGLPSGSAQVAGSLAGPAQGEPNPADSRTWRKVQTRRYIVCVDL